MLQVGGDMEGARVQHVSVGLQHVAALAVSTQMRQLPGRAQVHPRANPCGFMEGCPVRLWEAGQACGGGVRSGHLLLCGRVGKPARQRKVNGFLSAGRLRHSSILAGHRNRCMQKHGRMGRLKCDIACPGAPLELPFLRLFEA